MPSNLLDSPIHDDELSSGNSDENNEKNTAGLQCNDNNSSLNQVESKSIIKEDIIELPTNEKESITDISVADPEKCNKTELIPPPGSPKPENTARLRRYRLKQV